MNRIVNVRGIALHEGKLLGVRLNPYKGGVSVTEYWCIPGGRLDEGEDAVSGIRREMVEETGIEPEVGRLLYIQQYNKDEKEYLELFFHLENSADYLNIDLSKTTHGEEEIAEIDFVDPSSANILPKFLTEHNLEEFISNNQPVMVVNNFDGSAN